MQRERAMLLKEKIDHLNRQKDFRLTDDNMADYLSLNDPHWVALMSVLKEEVKTPRCDTEGDETVVGHSDSKILPNDLIILRLYLTFMDLEWAYQAPEQEFLERAARFIERAVEEGRDLTKFFHPEKAFRINENNKKRIKSLLVSLQKEKLHAV